MALYDGVAQLKSKKRGQKSVNEGTKRSFISDLQSVRGHFIKSHCVQQRDCSVWQKVSREHSPVRAKAKQKKNAVINRIPYFNFC